MSVDRNEAPLGFYAIAKPKSSESLPNICMACDFIDSCRDKNTDFTNHNNRCMSAETVSAKTGESLKRNDGQSVIFKRIN